MTEFEHPWAAPTTEMPTLAAHPTKIYDFVKRDEVVALFTQAVAQGMHAPFGLDCEYWGRKYQDKLIALLADDYPDWEPE